jgi:hypothetical protein
MEAAETIAHLNTKLPMTLSTFRFNFDEWNDRQKFEVIKCLLWGSDDIAAQALKLQKWVGSRQFLDSTD